MSASAVIKIEKKNGLLYDLELCKFSGGKPADILSWLKDFNANYNKRWNGSHKFAGMSNKFAQLIRSNVLRDKKGSGDGAEIDWLVSLVGKNYGDYTYILKDDRVIVLKG